MNLSSLSSADFKRIAKLLAQKESLLAKVAAIDQELAAFDSGRGKLGKTPKKSKEAGKRGKRGQLKDSILAILQESGKGGITVKELAVRLKREPANIHTWFFNTGKKIKQIEKVGEAKWAWVE